MKVFDLFKIPIHCQKIRSGVSKSTWMFYISVKDPAKQILEQYNAYLKG